VMKLKNTSKLIVLFLFLISLEMKNVYSYEKEVRVNNPYEGVGFGSFGVYKSNFHTHTTESDGRLDPDEVIYKYSEAEYDILALTDHNRVSWPWTNWVEEEPSVINRLGEMQTSAFFPELGTKGMLAVKGNEFSSGHHRGSFFNDLGGSQHISDIEDKGGMAMFYHPGRYSETASWYNSYYDSYRETVVGMEAYNQGDRYSRDREKWDAVNRERSPQDLVWGFSNDDMHSSGHLFRNYHHHYMDELNEESLRDNFITGAFTFSYEPGGSGEALAPVLKNVEVENGKIFLSAEKDKKTVWYDENTEKIKEGESIDVTDVSGSFVRAVIVNDNGRTYTQPFGFEIIISNWHDLHAIREDMGQNYVLKNDLDRTTRGYNEYASKLADGSSGWKPIGNSENKFEGNFNGNGYMIRDFLINRDEDEYIGLFGYNGQEGVIENIRLENAEVVGGEKVGAIVGENEGKIRNLFSECSVEGEIKIGGIVGKNSGNIINSASVGNVMGEDTAGGISGINSGEIENSYSAGEVTGTYNVGGLIGVNNNNVHNSFWDIETSRLEESEGGEGKTTAEMMDINTYKNAGWDIAEVLPNERKRSFSWNIVKLRYYPFHSCDRYGPDIIPPVIRDRTARKRIQERQRIVVEIQDDRSIKKVTGIYRSLGSDSSEKRLDFFPEPDGSKYYEGDAEIDFDLIYPDGFEYCIIASDENNTTTKGWIRVEFDREDPGYGFITPDNPELVFGNYAEEVVITDIKGNEVFSQSKNASGYIAWNPSKKDGKISTESGIYIYRIKTVSGYKYGTVVLAK